MHQLNGLKYFLNLGEAWNVVVFHTTFACRKCSWNYHNMNNFISSLSELVQYTYLFILQGFPFWSHTSKCDSHNLFCIQQQRRKQIPWLLLNTSHFIIWLSQYSYPKTIFWHEKQLVAQVHLLKHIIWSSWIISCLVLSSNKLVHFR